MSKISGSGVRRSARLAAARSMAGINNESYRSTRQPLAALPKNNKNSRKTMSTPERKEPVAPRRIFTIFSLNDDCVTELFSYLSMKDLCAISEISQRFYRLAIQAAANQFRRGEFVQLPKLDSYRAYECGPECEAHYLNNGREILCECFYYRAMDDDSAALMLMKFGKSITHLHIDGRTAFTAFCDRYANGHNFLSMINNCTSLEKIRLEKIQFRNTFQGLQTIFHNIEALELVSCGCVDVDLARMLAGANRLKHIALVKTNIFQMTELFSTIARLENLESLRITDCDTIEVTAFRLTLFFGELNKLKKLKKLELDADFIGVSHVEQIAKIDLLEELTFRHCLVTYTFLDALGKLRNLKVCKFVMDYAMSRPYIAVAETYFVVTVGERVVSERITTYTYTMIPKKKS